MKQDEINKNSFSLHDHENHELDIALLSLKIGLIAYLSTYDKVWRFFDFIITAEKEKEIQWIREKIRDSGYIQDYVETIYHFFLFIEISIKEILRKDHELLASLPGRHHEILYELLHNPKVISPEKLEKLQSISFLDALERLTNLIKVGKIEKFEKMKFIQEKTEDLKSFNYLRNRLVHRGTIVLEYKKLDELIGKDILPFVIELLNLPIYKYHEFRLQPKDLYCRIDPIQEIISECQTQDINFRRIAIFKQLALAAYANPIETPKSALAFKGPTIKEKAEERAKIEQENPVNLPIADIKTCPVCGAESLVRFLDSTPEYNSSWFIHSIYCFCCHFDLDSDNLKDVSINGLNIKEYWQLS